VQIKYRNIVVHHSASRRSVTTEDIREWHLAKGWSDIGYHFVIEEGGSINRGRDIKIRGAHSAGIGNRFGIGICVTGDNTVEDHEWTPIQKAGLIRLIYQIDAVIPGLEVIGHRDLPDRNTLCPGLDVREIVYGK